MNMSRPKYPGQNTEDVDELMSGLGNGSEDQNESESKDTKQLSGAGGGGGLSTDRTSSGGGGDAHVSFSQQQTSEINMRIPNNHLDFGTILPSLEEMEGEPFLHSFVHRK